MTTKQARELGIDTALARVAKIEKNTRRKIQQNGELFKALCRGHGLPEPVAEYQFHDTRKWRADWCFPTMRLLLEIDGGVFLGGRHTQGAGFEEDAEKIAEAMCLGWRVLRVTPKMVNDGRLFAWLKRIQRSV